jgi:hypothetical protein
MARLTIFLSTGLLLSLACGAEPPDGEGLPGGPDAGDPGPGDKPSLSIDQPPVATPYSRLPVTGTGPALGTVLAETISTTVTATIGTDGGFCIDVPLQTGAENTIWFRALDGSGTYSDEIEITVRQEGERPPTGDNQQPPPSMRNIAHFGAITHGGLEEEEGVFGLINDGDLDSSVRLRNHATASLHWFSIELSQTAPIDHIRVRSRADCPFPNYTIWATDAAKPPALNAWMTDPFGDPGPWTEIKKVTGGAVDQIIEPPLSTQPVARHVAFFWYGGGGCGPTLGTKRNEVIEIEVYTELEADEPPPPEDPSCASGGIPQ